MRTVSNVNECLCSYALLISSANSAGIIYDCDRLQDQAEQIAYHTQKGIDYLEKYGGFLKERAAIEEEYAGKLRSVVCTYARSLLIR